MRVGIFSIYDKKTASFMQPFFQLTRGQAVRTLQDSINDDSQIVSKHPEDFALYQVGVFDDAEGSVFVQEEERFVCNAEEVRQPSLREVR